MFTGCGTALVTPFKPDLSLDVAATRRLIQRQIREGIDFLVPCGTTGESPTLTREEHLHCGGRSSQGRPQSSGSRGLRRLQHGRSD
jgi:dihydrodipicolinate synthase/N-acetylneuraminate lyase